jgi:O-acetyl-ADP-ribose deacetylase (regulator of RNase III)
MAHSPVTLAEVSTLPQLYKDKTLKLPTKKSKFPYSKQFNNKISLWRGDITRLAVDAITNAANKNLTQGGGICGAIFKAAGAAKLREACAKIKTPLKPGDMRLTHGFDLPTGKIIHAVGPDCRIDEENEKRHDILSNLYFQLMLRSYMDGIKTVALCSISTGIYQYPLNEAVPIAVSWIRQFFETDPNQKKLDRVIFVVHDDETEEEYTRVIP